MQGRLKTNLKLAGMMFLEYAVWGAWMPIIGATMMNRHMPPVSISYVFAALYLGCLITPFIGGQLVDRLMPSQVFLGIAHLLAAVAAFSLAHQQSASGLVIGMFVWALLFAPTLGITNSIAFQHIEMQGGDEQIREKDFSIIRTSGTIGWIVSAFLLTALIMLGHMDPKSATGLIPEFLLTAALGAVMGIYSFSLPNTPPSIEKRSDPWAFREALSLFKSVPGFGVFMVISFIAATEFQFFYVLNSQFLESLHIKHALIPIVKSISQVTEVLALGLLLPLLLPKKGMRWCLLVGSFAWPIRYVIFAISKPVWLVVASLGLHGFGYAFVLVVQQLYVDRVAPKDIRGSAQSLLTLMTLGIGNLLGSLICGRVQGYFTVDGHTNWPPVFILPAITTLLCALWYMATFRNPAPEPELELASAR